MRSVSGNGIPRAVIWMAHRDIHSVLRHDTANACLHVFGGVRPYQDCTGRGFGAHLPKSEDIAHGKVLADLDHHIIRGILYLVHYSYDFPPRFAGTQECWEQVLAYCVIVRRWAHLHPHLSGISHACHPLEQAEVAPSMEMIAGPFEAKSYS